MRKVLIIAMIAVLGSMSTSQAQLNMTLLGSKTYTNELNDIWGYVDSLGNEYALVGVQDGVSIVDVTDPTNPQEVWFFGGPFSTWRDLKVWNKHCYVTNEANQGLFIIDLSNLPDTTIPTTAWYTGTTYPFASAHNLFIDENGVAYIMGADYNVGGAIMLDVDTDPLNPVELGVFDTYYLHDGMARGDTLWGGAINNGFFVAIDVSDKGNPTVLATQNTPTNFTHNAWISDDGNTLYTTDEKKNAFIGAYDVSDIGNITELDRIRSNDGSGVIVHNTHFMNDYVITSYYRDGVTVHDVTYPDNMIEVANYDTYAGSGNGFNGAWGVYPWLPSGNIIVSNIEDGLTVHGITYKRGSYLEGTVTDLFTTNAIPNATINILGTGIGARSNLTGGYKTGLADSNLYSIEFTAPGYIADTLSVVLDNGVLATLDAQLSSLPSFTLGGTVQESGSGDPVANAEVLITNTDFEYKLTTDGSGNFTIPIFYEGTFDVIIGKWNYITTCSEDLVIDTTTGTLTYTLDPGYYDDFAFDFGWNVTGTALKGIWERGEPLGTSYQGDPTNPELDVQGDCSDQAYVTGNTGVDYFDDDIDDGNTVLTSPLMNLTTYSDPYIEYYQWFFNDGGFGSVNDTLKISLHDGVNTVLLEAITAPSGQASWVYSQFKISDFLTPTPTMRLIVEAGDEASSGHLVEAGIDMFQIFDSIVISTPEIAVGNIRMAAFPNPFSELLEVVYKLEAHQANNAVIVLRDITGRIVLKETLNGTQGALTLNSNVAKGAYVLQLVSGGQVLKTLKVVKA